MIEPGQQTYPTRAEVRADWQGRGILVHLIYPESPDVLVLFTDQDGAGEAKVICLGHADRARFDADPKNPFRSWIKLPERIAEGRYPVVGHLVVAGRQVRAQRYGAG